MVRNLKKDLTRNLLNIPGWRTKRKIVVIESDDWGSIRMPSREVYEKFLDKGIRVDKDPYCKYDSVATPQDLEALFVVLNSVKDKNGNPAVLTANTVVANPVFDKIKESGFKDYFYEPFTDTLKRSKATENSFALWKQGIEAGVFHPQFHGREHLNVKKWMKALQAGEIVTKLAFELGTFGLTSDVDSRIQHNYMGAFNSGLPEDIAEYNIILKEGLDLFEKIFGFRSLSFIPTTYTWHPGIEPALGSNGVKYLQGMVHQRIPLADDTSFKYKKNNFSGNVSPGGLIYLMRNCDFEPTHFKNNFDTVDNCIRRVNTSFFYKKPAIISMHRVNLIGVIDPENRNENLLLLKLLLKNIVRKHPDVEFLSSDKLGSIIYESKKL